MSYKLTAESEADVNKDDIRKIVIKRVKAQCEGTSISMIGKRNDPRCQKYASVGSIFCKVHGGGDVERYIHPRDAQSVIDELSEALGVQA